MSVHYVYRFLDKNYEIIYVGRTHDFRTRMMQHFGDGTGHLSADIYSQVERVDYLQLPTPADAKIKELYYIAKYQPIYNTQDVGELELELPEVRDAWVSVETAYIFRVTEMEHMLDSI